MSADCGKLKNSNCFGRDHKGDFPKFGRKYMYNVCIYNITVIYYISV